MVIKVCKNRISRNMQFTRTKRLTKRWHVLLKIALFFFPGLFCCPDNFTNLPNNKKKAATPDTKC